jgi:hypothetical protein
MRLNRRQLDRTRTKPEDRNRAGVLPNEDVNPVFDKRGDNNDSHVLSLVSLEFSHEQASVKRRRTGKMGIIKVGRKAKKKAATGSVVSKRRPSPAKGKAKGAAHAAASSTKKKDDDDSFDSANFDDSEESKPDDDEDFGASDDDVESSEDQVDDDDKESDDEYGHTSSGPNNKRSARQAKRKRRKVREKY